MRRAKWLVPLVAGGLCMIPGNKENSSFPEWGLANFYRHFGSSIRSCMDIINRYGFNSRGIDHVKQNLTKQNQRLKRKGVVGINLGKNKESAVSDYVQGVRELGEYADYLVVNISSPNTPGLRDLQDSESLKNLLIPVMKERDSLVIYTRRTLPLLVKISPDLTDQQRREIAQVVMELCVDGLVVSNTSVSRPKTLIHPAAQIESGGLSGRAIQTMSTDLIRDMYSYTYWSGWCLFWTRRL